MPTVWAGHVPGTLSLGYVVSVSVNRDSSLGAHLVHETPTGTCFLKTTAPFPPYRAYPATYRINSGTFGLTTSSWHTHVLCHILTSGRSLAARCLPCPSPSSGYLLPLDKAELPQAVGRSLVETHRVQIKESQVDVTPGQCPSRVGRKGPACPLLPQKTMP